jgi:pSer/pThr/pTyr-binding forkhead associated (FHA) protein
MSMADRNRTGDAMRPHGHQVNTTLLSLLSQPGLLPPEVVEGRSIALLELRDEESKALVHVLEGESCVIGRDADCDLVFAEANKLSRRHFRLDIVDNEIILTDLGSKNGTRVNGCPVQTARLVLGDTIAAGGIELVLV